MKTIGIFAPARLGSQRLPNKQILPIKNTNMFEMCCQKLDMITHLYGIPTYVLICDEPLIRIASKYSNVKIILRDEGTAQVDGPLNYIYKDMLEAPVDYLMFLNPCLTFLSIETIIENIKKFLNSGKNYGTSVKKIQNWIWNTELKNVNYIDYKALNTKTIEPWYQCAHCFHVFNRENFKQDGLMLTDDLCLLEIPEKETIDIDTYEEYEYAKWKWEH